MLCHIHKVSNFFFCTPDLDFDNICLFSDVRDRNGIYKYILKRVNENIKKQKFTYTLASFSKLRPRTLNKMTLNLYD